MSRYLITRNDDFGSSRAANRAILEALECGCLTRNVSCMAPAPYLAEAAEALSRFQHVDLGMHATLNSEWDGIRWGALTEGAREAGLTEEDGTFFRSQTELRDHHPDIEAILREYDAQLDLLTRLGLKITYADSHMFPEYYIPGLQEAYAEWIRKKGLLDAENYYTLANPLTPPTVEDPKEYLAGVCRWLEALPENSQNFYLAHPAADTDEALLMYNERIPVGAMRLERSREHLAVTSTEIRDYLEFHNILPIRYSEATIGARNVMSSFLKER